MKILVLFIGLLSLCGCQSSSTPAKHQGRQTPEVQTIDVELNLKALKISLPELKEPVANYVHTVRTGNLVFTSGKGSSYPDGKLFIGKLGKDLTVAQGKEAARLAGIRLLAALKAELGDLNRVKRIVKVLGMVNATPEFTRHSQVINGFLLRLRLHLIGYTLQNSVK